MNDQRNQPKKSFLGGSTQTRAFRMGGYSTLLTVIVLAVAIVINLIMDQLPATVTKPDLTANQLFSFSEQTYQQAQNLDEDVIIYHLAQAGTEDALIQQFLEHYGGLSSHIQVKTKDPVVYPNVIASYSDEPLYNNSLLVVSQDGSCLLYTSIGTLAPT